MSLATEVKEYYALSSKDLSIESIRSLRFTSAVGIAAIILGLLITWRLLPMNLYTGSGLALGIVIGFVALVHRLPNLLALSERHLDEWCGDAKKDAEAFTYRVVIGTLVLTLIIGMALTMTDFSGLRLVLTPSFEQLGFTLILLPLLLQLITTHRLAWSVKPLSKEDVIDMYEIEKPRKSGKWTMILIVSMLMASLFGGQFIDRQFADIDSAASENCVISVTEDALMANVKSFENCK